MPEFIREKQAVGVGVREDCHALNLAWKFELEISLGSERGPNGQFVHELRGPRRLETLGEANVLGDSREAQGALAAGPTVRRVSRTSALRLPPEWRNVSCTATISRVGA